MSHIEMVVSAATFLQWPVVGAVAAFLSASAVAVREKRRADHAEHRERR